MSDRDPVVAVIGSRNYPTLDHPRAFVRRLHLKYPDAVVVSGGAIGVDQTAETEAEELGLGVISYRPRDENHTIYIGVFANDRAEQALGDAAIAYCRVLAEGTWPTFRDALLARNHMIVNVSDQVVAFWTKWSKGTLAAINYAHACKKPVHINPIASVENSA